LVESSSLCKGEISHLSLILGWLDLIFCIIWRVTLSMKVINLLEDIY
jgi:hypothetical protein